MFNVMRVAFASKSGLNDFIPKHVNAHETPTITQVATCMYSV